MAEPTRRRWRDFFKVHPAAELFPQLSEDELRALGEDIKAHGMLSPVSLWAPGGLPAEASLLLDGRNRLDACELVGLEVVGEDGTPADFVRFEYCSGDPWAYAVSANILRRHLTTAQKQELVAKLLRQNPERSDRATAELAKVSHPTVGKIRKALGSTGKIIQLNRTVGKDGRSRPASRQSPPRMASNMNSAPPAQRRDQLIVMTAGYLAHDPANFLVDIAAIMHDEAARLGRVSEHRRRAAFEKIGQALQLSAAADHENQQALEDRQ